MGAKDEERGGKRARARRRQTDIQTERQIVIGENGQIEKDTDRKRATDKQTDGDTQLWLSLIGESISI